MILIVTADLHLSDRPPVARSAETDWFAAMRRPLLQLRDLMQKHDAPLAIAGDVFDSCGKIDGERSSRGSKISPRLINFAIENLPNFFGVPGNHELPHHRLADLKRSPFWTLVEAKRAVYLEPGKPVELPLCRLHGFPFGVPTTPLKNPHSIALEIAIVHAYCWIEGCGHPEADPRDNAGKILESLKGYDLAVHGDNHKPFYVPSPSRCGIFNCGSLIRRTIDEKQHRPSVGLVKEDGTVEREYLDCSEDKFVDLESAAEFAVADPEIGRFIDELSALADSGISFRDALRRWCEANKVRSKVREFISAAMEAK